MLEDNLEKQHKILICGGVSLVSKRNLSDCWVFNLAIKQWIKVTCINQEEAAAGAGYSVVLQGNNLYFLNGNQLHEIKILNLTNLEWSSECLISDCSQGLP